MSLSVDNLVWKDFLRDYLIILSPVRPKGVTAIDRAERVVAAGTGGFECAQESLICSSLHMAIGEKMVLEFD